MRIFTGMHHNLTPARRCWHKLGCKDPGRTLVAQPAPPVIEALASREVSPRPAACAIASPPAGVAKTILVRLVLGLLGYGAVTAWFPFMPERIW